MWHTDLPIGTKHMSFFSPNNNLPTVCRTIGVIEGFKVEIYDLEKPVCETIKTSFANCVTNNVERCQIFVIYHCLYRFYVFFCAQYDSPRFPLVQHTRGVFDFYKDPAPCNTRKNHSLLTNRLASLAGFAVWKKVVTL